jgi:hypothetical protein
MEATLNRDLDRADIPPFSYVGISHTFKNSPYNEYPFAMARLRWFTDSFDPRLEDDARYAELSALRATLQFEAKLNGHFTYLQARDADAVDSVLDELYRDVTGGDERHASDLGPHEPGIGEWVNEGDCTQRYWLEFPYGIDRFELFEKVGDLLRVGHPSGEISGIYMYPPDYTGGPDGLVRHAFRVFGKSETVVRIDPELSALLS